MSTILEALRELEGTPAPGTQDNPPVPWTDESRRRFVVAAVAAVVLVAGAVGLVLGRGRSTPLVTAPAAPAPAPSPAVPHLRKHVTAPVERPWGVVQSKPAAVTPEPEPIERPPTHVAAVQPVERPAPPPEPTTTRIIGAPPVTPPRAPATAPRPIGAPHIRVAALAYADNRGERVVSVAVDGGTPVTLHEGESADGIEVQLILPDRVYVRHGSNVFAVDAKL